MAVHLPLLLCTFLLSLSFVVASSDMASSSSSCSVLVHPLRDIPSIPKSSKIEFQWGDFCVGADTLRAQGMIWCTGNHPERFLTKVKHLEVRAWALKVHSLWRNLSCKVTWEVEKNPQLQLYFPCQTLLFFLVHAFVRSIIGTLIGSFDIHRVTIVDFQGHSHNLNRYKTMQVSSTMVTNSMTQDKKSVSKFLNISEKQHFYHDIASSVESGWNFNTR
ncbi:hypothetical protein Ahy_A03g013323 [Arachis hypogaea]|uniref:Alpha,alpha-trehalose glucohydrolase n=1 Tax=Arachis hypogaea TaxID=3818 RepID=A0A445DV83_ARAHY|nr:hypothetical protein Ahy_A03g013323 [Arachis hypogaea]